MPRATSWVFDVDQQRLNTNMLPGEADTLVEYVRKQLYQQPPLLNAMYNTEQRMQEIMEPPQLSAVEKSKLYSDQMNRFLTFKNKMYVPAHHPTHHKCLLLQYLLLLNLRPRLKRNFFHNCRRKWYGYDATEGKRAIWSFFYYKKRPKYIPMKPEDIARLSSEDRQEYEKSSKIQDT